MLSRMLRMLRRRRQEDHDCKEDTAQEMQQEVYSSFLLLA